MGRIDRVVEVASRGESYGSVWRIYSVVEGVGGGSESGLELRVREDGFLCIICIHMHVCVCMHGKVMYLGVAGRDVAHEVEELEEAGRVAGGAHREELCMYMCMVVRVG